MQRSTNTLVRPSDIVFTAVYLGKKDLSISVCVSVFPSSLCHVFQDYGDKIISPERFIFMMICGRAAAKICMTCWQLPCQKAPNRLLHDLNKVKKTTPKHANKADMLGKRQPGKDCLIAAVEAQMWCDCPFGHHSLLCTHFLFQE